EWEDLEKPQYLDILSAGMLGQSSFEQTVQLGEALRQLPSRKRSGLVQRPALVFQQSQVVQRIVDGSFAFVAALVFGDDFAPRYDHDVVDVSLDQHLAMAVPGRNRVIVGAVANQRDGADACGRLVAGLEASRRQRQQCCAVAFEAFADGLPMATQPL